MCPYLIITISVTVAAAGRNFSHVSHIFEEGTIVFWSRADRLNDRSALRQSHQLCHEPKQSLHGDESTQAFYLSRSCPANKNYLELDSYMACPSELSLNPHVDCFSAQGHENNMKA